MRNVGGRTAALLGGLALAAGLLAPVGAVGEPAVAGAAPTSARAAVATTVGQVNPTPNMYGSCSDMTRTSVQTASGAGAPSYAVPTAGVITAFRHQAAFGTGTITGLVTRPGDDVSTPTYVGRSASVTLEPGELATMPARIAVAAGDELGLQTDDATDDDGCYFPGVEGDTISVSFLDDSDTPELGATISGVTFRLNLSAVLEPDADHDGYGDVSQDKCPTSAATAGACPVVAVVPNTRITKAPKTSSTKRTATIAFTSTVKGSTFTCAVDKKKAKPCRSPFTATYAPGKHRVVVTAIGPTKLKDRTPAVVTFTVKRR